MEVVLAAQLLPTIAVVVALVLLLRRSRAAWAQVNQTLQQNPQGMALLTRMRGAARRAQLVASLGTVAAIVVLLAGAPFLVARSAAQSGHGALPVDQAYRIAMGDLWIWIIVPAALPLFVGALALVLIIGEFSALRAARRVLAGAKGDPALLAELRGGWAHSAVLAFGVVGVLLGVIFAGSVVVLMFAGASYAIACAQPGGSKCY